MHTSLKGCGILEVIVHAIVTICICINPDRFNSRDCPDLVNEGTAGCHSPIGIVRCDSSKSCD